MVKLVKVHLYDVDIKLIAEIIKLYYGDGADKHMFAIDDLERNDENDRKNFTDDNTMTFDWYKGTLVSTIHLHKDDVKI